MSKDLVKHLGGCHCGAVRFEVMAPRNVEIFNCSCSICKKKKMGCFIVPNSRFKLLQGEDNLTCYTYNTKQAKHMFCKTCGVQSFYCPRSNPEGKGIEVKCLDEGTIDSVTVIDFDGANWDQAVASYPGDITHFSKTD